MSLDDGNHASSHGKQYKEQRSMDMEFHDHVESDDEGTEPLTDPDLKNSNGVSSHHQPGPGQTKDNDGNDSDSDFSDDSFGEASDDCEPDQEFLDQILQEYHPERLNLLDRSIPEPLKPGSAPQLARPSPGRLLKNNAAKNLNVKVAKEGDNLVVKNMTDSEDEDEDAAAVVVGKNLNSCKKEESPSPSPEKDKDEAAPAKPVEKDEEDEEDETEEAADSFRSRGMPPRRNMLTSMGQSTKKSLRTINGSFWAKPFKGLAKSIRRPGGQKPFH
jgi:hypothetical protein